MGLEQWERYLSPSLRERHTKGCVGAYRVAGGAIPSDEEAIPVAAHALVYGGVTVAKLQRHVDGRLRDGNPAVRTFPVLVLALSDPRRVTGTRTDEARKWAVVAGQYRAGEKQPNKAP
jgi:hypothetical protein